MSIPFNKPFIVGKELYYISQAVLGGHIAGDGTFTKRCQRWLEEATGAPRVLVTHSCTAALEIAAILCNITEGDEVILPSYTFVSTANAFVLRGAKPVFADIRSDTLNMDETAIESLATDRTKAIVPVHYAGIGCEMTPITEVAHRRGLKVVEDAAQGVDARKGGRPLGTFGDLGALSFHETKNYISGEGGALVINDAALVERAEIIREKGTNRSQFFRGEIDKYTWVDIGSSFLPSDIIAAFLFAQLEEADTITQKRHRVFDRYMEMLDPLATRGLLELPTVPEDCEHNGHMFYVLMRSASDRTGLLNHLNENQIHAVFHYVPLHLSPMGRHFGYAKGDLPITEELAQRVIRLPCYFELSEDEQKTVVTAIHSFFGL
jgi:dTDP-4-amino-4,6-dideoxygalactose transaminase